jgi:hypothetical protein
MQINSVPYCLECKEYLVTGVCGTCGRPCDDHGARDAEGKMGPAFVGPDLQRCPPADPTETP